MSTSIVNQSNFILTDTVDRENTGCQLWIEDGINPVNYIDIGAQEDTQTMEVHLFMRPTSNKLATVRNYKRDMSHMVEEVKRAIRGMRGNMSGYEHAYVTGVIPLDITDDPNIDPPVLERQINVRMIKIREILT